MDETTCIMLLNSKLRERRKALGLSMKEVATIVGVAEATISRWETGDISNMKRDKIALYANALKLSPIAIMGLDSTAVCLEDETAKMPSVYTTETDKELLEHFHKLNDTGKKEAIARVQEMTELSQYTAAKEKKTV